MPHLPDLPTWLLSSLIYLSAAVVAVAMARFLGVGATPGYLGEGKAMGPWGLGLVSEVADILHFAGFGVVLMLFLVGLELEPHRHCVACDARAQLAGHGRRAGGGFCFAASRRGGHSPVGAAPLAGRKIIIKYAYIACK